MVVPSLSGPNPTGQATTEPAAAARPPVRVAPPVPPAAEAPAPATAELSAVVDRARAAVREVASNLEFSVDGDTGKTVVRVVDTSTQELIRQIPSEEMLSIARHMDRLEGLLIKSKA